MNVENEQKLVDNQGKISSCVDVIAKLNNEAIGLLSDALRVSGAKNLDEKDNCSFLKSFLEKAEVAFQENHEEESNQYIMIMKDALRDEVIPSIIYELLVKSNGEKPESYKDIRIEANHQEDFIKIYFNNSTEEFVVVDTRNENHRIPNNLYEMIMDVCDYATRKVKEMNELVRFVADIEELLVDYRFYEKHENSIVVTNLETKKQINFEHRQMSEK